MDTIWPPDFETSSGSKYIVLIQSLRAAIRSGQLVQGERLPPVRELAWQLGITPGTVARAYKMATDEGLVETGVGRGTFVAGGAPPVPVLDVPLIHVEQPEYLDFRAVRVADVGQEQAIRGIMGRLAQNNDHSYLDYPTPKTDLQARKAVVDWVGADRVGRVGPEDVVLGLGAQNCVMLILQTCLSGPSPVILTEHLAYPGVRHAARLLRAQLVGVKMDQHGMRPDKLEDALRRHGGQVLMTSAEVHSPTGVRTTLERRQEIADLARQYQLQIVEDDCHCVVRPDSPAYRAICPERGWFVSSLTKSVSAALRFGFVVCPHDLADITRQVAQSSFYGLPQPILDIAEKLLSSGEAERIRTDVAAELERKVKIAVNILGRWDIRWRPDMPFIWLHLPQGWRGSTFARACEAKGIRVKAADEFAMPDGFAPHAVRISLNSSVPPEAFEAALGQMSKMLGHPPLNVDL